MKKLVHKLFIILFVLVLCMCMSLTAFATEYDMDNLHEGDTLTLYPDDTIKAYDQAPNVGRYISVIDGVGGSISPQQWVYTTFGANLSDGTGFSRDGYKLKGWAVDIVTAALGESTGGAGNTGNTNPPAGNTDNTTTDSTTKTTPKTADSNLLLL